VTIELLSSDRLPFMINNFKKGDDLASILTMLPKNERLSFANKYLDKISCDKELCMVADELTRNDERHDFIMANQAKITDGCNLAAFATMIKPEFRTEFIMWHQGLISSGDELGEVVALLEPDIQNDFITAHLDTIQSGVDLRSLLRMIPSGTRFEIATTCQNKIADFKQLLDIIEILYEREGYLLAKANFDRLKEKNQHQSHDSYFKGSYLFSIFSRTRANISYYERIVEIIQKSDYRYDRHTVSGTDASIFMGW
jgi:hypothetical protein